jgi:hypothetical protein
VRPNQIQIRRNSLSDDLAVMGFIFPAGERLARDGRDIARVARRAGAANRIEYTQIEFIVDDNWRRFANTLNRGQIRFEIQESDGSLLFDRNFYAGGRRDCAKEESALCSRGVRPPSGIIHGFRPFIQRQADSRGVRWAFYLDVDYRFYIIARLPTEVLARARRAVVRYEPGL